MNSDTRLLIWPYLKLADGLVQKQCEVYLDIKGSQHAFKFLRINAIRYVYNTKKKAKSSSNASLCPLKVSPAITKIRAQKLGGGANNVKSAGGFLDGKSQKKTQKTKNDIPTAG